MKTPGVGYPGRDRSQLKSHAGDAHGITDFPPINFSAPDPFERGISGTEQFARLEQWFGPHRNAGVSGDHENIRQQYLRDQFAARQAPWITDPADYDKYDGEPTPLEVAVAYNSKDPRVHQVAPASGGGINSGADDGGDGFRRPQRTQQPRPPHRTTTAVNAAPAAPAPMTGPSGDPGPGPAQPAADQYARVQVPADVTETLQQLEAWADKPLGPGKTARLVRVREWLSGTELYVKK